jgi:hypothetical protein
MTFGATDIQELVSIFGAQHGKGLREIPRDSALSAVKF